MKTHLRCLLTAIGIYGIVGLSIPIHAEVLTIEFSEGVYSPPGSDTVYTEKGLIFSVPTGNHTDCGPLGADAFGIAPFEVYCWHNGGGNTTTDNNVVLELDGGGAFDLISLDIVEDPFNQNQTLPPFTIDLISSAGSVTVDGHIPATIELDWNNITSVTMSVNDDPNCVTDGCRHSAVIDNVAIGVPEPSSLVILAIGGGMTLIYRRLA